VLELAICGGVVIMSAHNPGNNRSRNGVLRGKLIPNGKEFLAKPQADGVFNILPPVDRGKRVDMYGGFYAVLVGNGYGGTRRRLLRLDINIARLFRRGVGGFCRVCCDL